MATLRRLRLPAVTAARVTAAADILASAVTSVCRCLTALRVARTGRARIAAVGTWVGGLTRLPLLPSLRAGVACPGLPGTDRGEVGKLPLILRRGVIPLPLLGHIAVLTRPAATRSAGE